MMRLFDLCWVHWDYDCLSLASEEQLLLEMCFGCCMGKSSNWLHWQHVLQKYQRWMSKFLKKLFYFLVYNFCRRTEAVVFLLGNIYIYKVLHWAQLFVPCWNWWHKWLIGSTQACDSLWRRCLTQSLCNLPLKIPQAQETAQPLLLSGQTHRTPTSFENNTCVGNTDSYTADL